VYYGRKGCAVREASNTTVTLIVDAHIIVVDIVMTVVDIVVVVNDVTTTAIIVVAVAGVFANVTLGAFSTILSWHCNRRKVRKRWKRWKRWSRWK
jgi:hypothetical protein